MPRSLAWRRRENKLALARTLALLGTWLSPGCALVTATPPDVEVAAVELRAVGLLDQVLGVTLCVHNPNRTELSFRAVAVAVEVGGAPLATGASEAAVVLPPLSSVVVPFAVTTTIRNVGSQLLAVLRGGGGVDYKLSGTVSLAGSLPLSVPFSRSGRLDFLTAGREVLADSSTASPRCRNGGTT